MRWRTGLTLAGLLAFTRCAITGTTVSGEAAMGPAEDRGAYPAIGAGGAAGSAAAVDAGVPEKKIEKTFEAPVATTRYVWSANPKTGRVALIDAATFQIRTVEAGGMPTWLAAIPGADDRVLVINVGTSDASLITSQTNAIAERRYRVQAGANAWSVSDDGRFAIAWTDAVRVAGTSGVDLDAVDPASGFQEVTIIDLTLPPTPGAADVPPRIAVGFRPAQIVFAHGKARAFAVTADGIDVLDLSEAGNPTLAQTIAYELPPAPSPSLDAGVKIKAAKAPDVSITPDGTYAIARRDGSATLDIVDLTTAEQKTFELAGPISDATLSPDGKYGLAVIRTLSEVDVVPIPATLETIDRLGITGQTVGRALVTADAKQALLFTTVSPVDRLVSLTLATREFRAIPLHAPVAAVFPTADALHAIVLHDSYAGKEYSSPGAVSIVPLAQDRSARIEPLGAPPKQVALAPDGTSAIVTARDDRTAKYFAYVARMPSLMVDTFALASPPMAVGMVDAMGYVAQEHTEGRVTFIDLAAGTLHTVTGFELGASVYEWPARDGGQ
jgi:hypothetical protein